MAFNYVNICGTLLILSFINEMTNSDFYSSTAEMESLLKTEKQLVGLIDLYIETEQKRINLIKELAKNISFSSVANSQEAESFLSNPINIYHLIKRLSVQINPLLKLINSTQSNVFQEMAGKRGISLNFPDKEDLEGVLEGLNRLRIMYNLPVTTLVKGEFTNKSKSLNELTALECFEIGNKQCLEGSYNMSIPWLEEALAIEEREIVKTINRLTVLSYLTYSYYKVNAFSKAIKTAEEYLKIDPNNTQMQSDLEYYRITIQLPPNIPEKRTNLQDQLEAHLNAIHDQLCRNERLQNFTESSKLNCYHSTHKSPYLILQPNKIEDVNLKPWVAVFHDVMRDTDIEQFKEDALPELTRALVGGANAAGRVSQKRISKFAWLWEWNNTRVANLKRRLEAITGMILIDNSEPLQVNNYGIGGFYDTHTDYTDSLPKNSEFHQYFGNRIATLLFYLNDVIAGGATVFPHLKINVFPEKGSAVFWYNLLKSGMGNPMTLHGGCPVLAGVKWVANAWIREFPQMFKSPCGLKEYDMHNR